MAHDRRTITGGQWRDPRVWLTLALRATGRNPAEIQRTFLPRTGSRKAQAIADLAAYEEARGMLADLVTQGRQDLEPRLAALCMDKAFIHQSLNDQPGAVVEYDRTIAIYDRLTKCEGQSELAHELAKACIGKGTALRAQKDLHNAVRLYERARTIQEGLVEREGQSEFASDLATACMNEAVYRPGLIGHFAERNPRIRKKPDPVPVTMVALALGMKFLSDAAASRLGLRLDPELSRTERAHPRRRRTRTIPRLGSSPQLRGQLD
jgi:hypothetical protein